MTIRDLPAWDKLRGVLNGSVLCWAAVSLYTLSLFKYAVRDPLAANVGVQGPLEITLLLLAVALSLVPALRTGRVRISRPVLALCAYALLSLISSINSFYPVLSAAKAAAVLGALVLAVLLCNSLGPREVLRRFCVVMAIEVAVLLAAQAIAPDEYPGLRLDTSGRTRLWILHTHPGVLADYAAIALVLATSINPPCAFLLQLLFLGVLVASQGRTAIAATLVLLVAGVVAGRNRGTWTLRRVAPIAALLVGLAAIVFLFQDTVRGWTVGERTVAEMPSISGRTPIWAFTIPLVRERTLLGVGPDGARPLFLERFGWASSPHSGYLDVFLAAGWIGGLLFLAGWGAAVAEALLLAPLDRRVGLLLLHAYLGVTALIGGLVSPSTTAGIFLLGVLAQASSEPHDGIRA